MHALLASTDAMVHVARIFLGFYRPGMRDLRREEAGNESE